MPCDETRYTIWLNFASLSSFVQLLAGAISPSFFGVWSHLFGVQVEVRDKQSDSLRVPHKLERDWQLERPVRLHKLYESITHPLKDNLLISWAH